LEEGGFEVAGTAREARDLLQHQLTSSSFVANVGTQTTSD
jgi:hypothetical protein